MSSENRDKPLVSVLTATYNHEAFIADCIQSVRDQTYEKWEMIIVDDGSVDGTGAIARAFANQDPRVCYVRQENRGIGHLANTYNDMFSRAEGEFVAIIEGDDLWPPAKLESMVSSLAQLPDAVLAYGFTEVLQTGPSGTVALKRWKIPGKDFAQQPAGVLTNSPPGRLVPRLLCGPVFMPVSTLIRYKAINALGGFRAVADGHAVDYATFLHLALAGRFIFIPQTTGYWRRHQDQANASPRLNEMMRADYDFALGFMQKNKKKLELSQEAEDNIRRSWRQNRAGAHLRTGRYFLSTHEWQRARNEFAAVIRLRADWRRSSYAVAGILMSVLRWSARKQD
jgi:glycosyltransferase involved in cell wall biosynthesis